MPAACREPWGACRARGRAADSKGAADGRGTDRLTHTHTHSPGLDQKASVWGTFESSGRSCCCNTEFGNCGPGGVTRAPPQAPLKDHPGPSTRSRLMAPASALLPKGTGLRRGEGGRRAVGTGT